ncbi:MAG TPA: POTRA domain-containing protein [Candidatus Acidoferrales bacterium]|nr:POTRA domain-containing protein [Candidatus Acidoferrales bacterium]
MKKSAYSRSFLLLLGFCAAAAAQNPRSALDRLPASERTLISIKVVGSKRYTDQQISAASGLQLGAPIVEDDLKKAAVRLGDTGVFTDIGYTYSYSISGTKLQLQVTDADRFVPVRFEDFVWFTDAEMLQRIKEYAPLFDGQLPTSGKLADQVSDVLQAMLVERSIPGHVDYVRSGKNDGPVDSIVYSVSDVLIQIRNVNFNGADAAELPDLKEASRRVFEREYSRTVLSALVQKQLLPIYYARGYLKAEFSGPAPKVVKQPSPTNDEGLPNLTVVDVNFNVAPGKQYRLKGLDWSGNHEIPTEVLQKMVRVRAGEPANTVKLRDNLGEIQKLYGSKGYVTAGFKTQAEFDDAAGTVQIHIAVSEGYEYHMGDLQYRGLDNSLTAKLRNAWKLRPGDVYNSAYLDEYLPVAHKLLPSNFDWEVASHVTPNLRDKTVDVDLIYTVKALQPQ